MGNQEKYKTKFSLMSITNSNTRFCMIRLNVFECAMIKKYCNRYRWLYHIPFYTMRHAFWENHLWIGFKLLFHSTNMMWSRGTTNMMWSRKISRKSNIWHFQFSTWLKSSLRGVHFAEKPTWIGPVVPSYSNWKILKTIENKRNSFLFLAVSHLTINAPNFWLIPLGPNT